MYAYIEGKLTGINPAFAIIDCQGVAYELNISLHTYTAVKDSDHCRLYTHLVVREDAQILYGFAQEEERSMFRHLISVSGVGSNTARMILSSMRHSEVYDSILLQDSSRLQAVKGIGAKSAQRIIVDLSDRLKKQGISPDILGSGNNTLREETLSALVMLGFNKIAASKVIDKIITEEGMTLTVEELVKMALQRL